MQRSAFTQREKDNAELFTESFYDSTSQHFDITKEL